jgi:uncharacterized membrane protein
MQVKEGLSLWDDEVHVGTVKALFGVLSGANDGLKDMGTKAAEQVAVVAGLLGLIMCELLAGAAEAVHEDDLRKPALKFNGCLDIQGVEGGG